MFYPRTSDADTRAVLALYADPAAPRSAPTPADWQRLRDKLARVAEFAPTVAGVDGHRWCPGTPRLAAEIEAHERRLGRSLPAEYREFLRELGDRAPGPNGRLRGLFEDHGDDASTCARWDGVARLNEHSGWGPLVRGALALAHRCTWGTFVLALDGPAPGTIWLSLSQGSRVHPTGLGVFAWYEHWLDGVLATIIADDAALHRCEQEVAVDPSDGAAWSRLVCEALARGRDARAAEALTRARALGCEPTLSERASLVVRITTLPADAAIAARVRALLALGLPLPPFSVSALRYELGYRLGLVGRHDEALTALLTILGDGSQTSRTVMFRHTLASTLFALGRPTEALKHSPDWEGLAFPCLVQLGRLDEASALLERLPGDRPREQGILQFKRGDLDAARRTFAELVRRPWPDAEHHYQLARVLAHQGELAEAEATLERALFAGFDGKHIDRDPDAAPLRATATYRRWFGE